METAAATMLPARSGAASKGCTSGHFRLVTASRMRASWAVWMARTL